MHILLLLTTLLALPVLAQPEAGAEELNEIIKQRDAWFKAAKKGNAEAAIQLMRHHDPRVIELASVSSDVTFKWLKDKNSYHGVKVADVAIWIIYFNMRRNDPEWMKASVQFFSKPDLPYQILYTAYWHHGIYIDQKHPAWVDSGIDLMQLIYDSTQSLMRPANDLDALGFASSFQRFAYNMPETAIPEVTAEKREEAEKMILQACDFAGAVYFGLKDYESLANIQTHRLYMMTARVKNKADHDNLLAWASITLETQSKTGENDSFRVVGIAERLRTGLWLIYRDDKKAIYAGMMESFEKLEAFAIKQKDHLALLGLQAMELQTLRMAEGVKYDTEMSPKETKAMTALLNRFKEEKAAPETIKQLENYLENRLLPEAMSVVRP